MDSAERVLCGDEQASEPQRQRLSQLLAAGGTSTSINTPLPGREDEALVDALDCGQRVGPPAPRPARGTRHALSDTGWNGDTVQEAIAALDPRVPLGEVTARRGS